MKSLDANDAAAVCCRALCGGSYCLGRNAAKVLSHVELHAVDLSQKPGSRSTVVHRVGLSPTEMSELLLEPGDAFQGRLELQVVRDHDSALTISTIPRRPPSRRVCQSSPG